MYNKAKSDNATFRAEVEKWSREPALKQVRLENLLIAPVQRLMRYRLLIEAILTYTPPSHREFQSLMDASKEVHAIAARLDAIKAKTQATALLHSVLADIDQLPVLFLSIIERIIFVEKQLKCVVINIVGGEGVDGNNKRQSG